MTDTDDSSLEGDSTGPEPSCEYKETRPWTHENDFHGFVWGPCSTKFNICYQKMQTNLYYQTIE